MSSFKAIRKITKGVPSVDGAGVKLVRVIGYNDTSEYDPFLMLDAFDSTNQEDYIKGFPWHPHRGIETITYLIEGDIAHGDSLGNAGNIHDGDCQWMSAGSGIIHQEMPQPKKRMLGVQLWLNLPAKNKMVKPQYGSILKENIPVIEKEGSIVRVIAGNYLGIKGSFEGSYVKATFLDVEIAAGREWTYDCEEESNLFIYIVQGEGSFDPDSNEVIEEKHAVLFHKGDTFFASSKKGIRFLLFLAKPLKEPIAWGGPIVMNTEEELTLAFQELDKGTFIKE
jgi:quercetin 2,3-dioxygenase